LKITLDSYRKYDKIILNKKIKVKYVLVNKNIVRLYCWFECIQERKSYNCNILDYCINYKGDWDLCYI